MHPVRLLHLLIAASALTAPSAFAAQTTAYVVTSDYATGSLAAIGLDTRTALANLASLHGDARARWRNGLLHVVNRFGQDNVQVIDPAQGFGTVRQYSTGAGSNPHDIAFASPAKAYVTRYDATDLLIVNPQSGAVRGSIPLGGFADADGIPEMDQMIQVGTRVFVSLQRLDRNAGFVPADSSLVVVIDADADTVIDANPAQAGVQGIRLAAANPFTGFEFDRATSRLLIGCAGFFGALDGAVVRIDPVNLESDGVVIDEVALGGDINDLVWNGPGRSWAIVSDASFNALLVSFSNGALEDTVFAPGGFNLSDAALNDRGELYVGKTDFLGPGVFVFDAATHAALAGPIDTGLPPFQIVFDENSGQVASVPPPAAGLALAPAWPNPARDAVRFSVTLERAGALDVGVYDVAGRRVRTLFAGEAAGGTRELRWDMNDASGGRVAAGVFWLAARSGRVLRTQRIVALP